MELLNQLNRAASPWIRLVKSMTPAARAAATMFLLLMVVSLGYLWHTRAGSGEVYLIGGESFGVGQLTAMEAAFAKAGLNGYEIDAGRVRVPRANQYAYMAALADAGALPPSFGKYLERAAASASPFMSKKQQEEITKVAKQHELQEVICKMKGIEVASVLYEVQPRHGFGQEDVITACVNVKPLGEALDEQQVPLLRHMVASAIGMKPDNVTVTDLNGRIYPAGANLAAGSGGLDDLYTSKKKAHERDWVNKISAVLAYIPGVIIAANVELDVDTAREISTIEPTGDNSPSSHPSLQGSAASDVSAAAPLPQSGANQAASVLAGTLWPRPQAAGGSPDRAAVAQRSTHVTQQGLTPKRVTVSVAIPNTYYARIWAQRHASAGSRGGLDPRELAEIERKVTTDVESAVCALLPWETADQNQHPRVRVTSFQPIAPSAAPASGTTERVLSWLDRNSVTLGVAALALVGLAMLRSLVRATLGAAAASSAPAPEPIPEPHDALARRGARSRAAAAPSLRDELAGMIQDDPDSAASVLRTWIGSAS